MSYELPRQTPPRKDKKRSASRLRLWRVKERRIPVYTLLVCCLAILLIGWVWAGTYDAGIEQLRVTIQKGGDEVFYKEQEIRRLEEQVRQAGSDQFIATEARTKYGYLYPGEIRYVVTNPEALGLPPLSGDSPLGAP